MPAAESTPRAILRNVLIVVAVAIVLYLIYLLRRPLSWLVIAAFIAIAVSGPVNFLSQWMRRGLAIALVYIALILIPVGIGALIIPGLVSQGEDLGSNAPEYAQDVGTSSTRTRRSGTSTTSTTSPASSRRRRTSCPRRSAMRLTPSATSGSAS